MDRKKNFPAFLGNSADLKVNSAWSFAYSYYRLGFEMSANLPLHEMSFEEKLQAMEALWEDLSREPDRIESPSWHQDLLKETERRVESGQRLRT